MGSQFGDYPRVQPANAFPCPSAMSVTGPAGPNINVCSDQIKRRPGTSPSDGRVLGESTSRCAIGNHDQPQALLPWLTAEFTRDYSLIGPSAERAAEQGLVAAEWYHPDVPRKRMKQLMRRTDGPALRDTGIWLALLIVFGFGGAWFWGSWACVPFFVVYGVLYGSASDSRWHEAGHGTAFRTPWLNDVLYQVASFMNMKEPTFWRWSHARHHTDTIIVGRDREIAAMRPPTCSSWSSTSSASATRSTRP